MAWVQVQHGPAKGIWLKLNPRTGHDYFQGTVEPEVQQRLVEHLRAGMTVYDIGANIGFFSLLAARLVGPSGHVFAFEPEPALVPRLRENIARNGCRHIEVVEAAVSRHTARVPFARASAERTADYGLGRVSEEHSPATITVAAVALDDFVREHSLPDLVKCDVEGAEVDVFCGATQLLRARKTIFLCELHSRANEAALHKLLEQHCYICARLDQNHLLAKPLPQGE